MTRYRVEFEIEGELTTAGPGWLQWIDTKDRTYSIPVGGSVTEIKPPFEPGYYRRRGRATADVRWQITAPPVSQGDDWRDLYVRVGIEPEED